MPIQTNPAGTAPSPSPLDGRITSLPALTAVIGGELMEITSPGNSQFGNSYQVTTNALAAFANGISPIQPSLNPPLMDQPTAVVGVSGAYSREDHVHPSDTSRAPLNSPIFTGNPQVPTASLGTSSSQIASCAFVETAVSGILPPNPSTTPPFMDGIQTIGTSLNYARADHIHPTDTSLAPLNSPAFTGVPSTATTPPPTDISTNLATTAFVATAVATMPTPATVPPPMDSGATGSVGTTIRVYALSDHYHPTDTSRAPLASPAFTGIPTAATAGDGTATTQIATTQFVGTAVTNVGAGATDFPIMDGPSAVVGAKITYARADHVHPSDTTKLNDAPSDGNFYARQNAAWAIPSGLLVAFNAYSTSQTITVPGGVSSAVVELWGGTGGSGGGGTLNPTYGQTAGTGAAGFLRKRLTGLAGGTDTFTYTQGAGGTAGAAAADGGPGGTSTLVYKATTLTAHGSAGSFGSGGSPTVGTAGGTATGGDFNLTGQKGTNALQDGSGYNIMAGHGGSTMYSIGADGANNNQPGNPGNPGGCQIWWYT